MRKRLLKSIISKRYFCPVKKFQKRVKIALKIVSEGCPRGLWCRS
jgi:hypothetical protein